MRRSTLRMILDERVTSCDDPEILVSATEEINTLETLYKLADDWRMQLSNVPSNKLTNFEINFLIDLNQLIPTKPLTYTSKYPLTKLKESLS